MSTIITEATRQTAAQDFDPRRPYRDYTAVQLWESLEAQCDRGGMCDHAMVWELALRACELEALSER